MTQNLVTCIAEVELQPRSMGTSQLTALFDPVHVKACLPLFDSCYMSLTVL